MGMDIYHLMPSQNSLLPRGVAGSVLLLPRGEYRDAVVDTPCEFSER